MIGEEIKRKRAEWKMLERLYRRGGATLVIGDDGTSQITIFYNTKRFCRG